MRHRVLHGLLVVGVLVSCGMAADQGPIERIEKGLGQAGSKVKQTFAGMRSSINNLGVEGRVYARLRWDKALDKSHINLHIDHGVVTLGGQVASDTARQRAVDLTQQTVGVTEVRDHLMVAAEQSNH